MIFLLALNFFSIINPLRREAITEQMVSWITPLKVTYRFETLIEDLNPLDVESTQFDPLADLGIRVVRCDGGFGPVFSKTVCTIVHD